MDLQEHKPFKPFRFLDLAPELRHKIYSLITTSPHSYIDLSSNYKSPHTHFPHALLLTCTQIYHELRHLYFTDNAFSLTLFRRNETWSHLLSPPFLDNRRQIRSLRIIIWRWGAKDFFCHSLIPSLEDCILNGELRELEVVIRDGSLGTASLVHGMHEGRKENENWRMLGRVLRDPYLEKASLKAGRLVRISVEEDGESWDLERCEDVTWLLWKPGFDQDGTSAKVISANYCRNL
jgi:hypothetical protein